MSERNRNKENKTSGSKSKIRSRTLRNSDLLVRMNDESVQQRLQEAVTRVIAKNEKKVGAGISKKRKFEVK